MLRNRGFGPRACGQAKIEVLNVPGMAGLSTWGMLFYCLGGYGQTIQRISLFGVALHNWVKVLVQVLDLITGDFEKPCILKWHMG